MNVWLDDVREVPEEFDIWCKTAREMISVLQQREGQLEMISLDHDLGENEYEVGNGYQVVTWIEQQVALTDYVPPKEIRVHSANPIAKKRMLQCIDQIHKLVKERNNAPLFSATTISPGMVEVKITEEDGTETRFVNTNGSVRLLG